MAFRQRVCRLGHSGQVQRVRLAAQQTRLLARGCATFFLVGRAALALVNGALALLRALLLRLLNSPDLTQAAGERERAKVFELLVGADDAVDKVRVLGEVVKDDFIECLEHEEEQSGMAFV